MGLIILGVLCIIAGFCGVYEDSGVMKLIGILFIVVFGILAIMGGYSEVSDNDILYTSYDTISSVTQLQNTNVIKVNGKMFETTQNFEVGDIVEVKYMFKDKSEIYLNGTVYKPTQIMELKYKE